MLPPIALSRPDRATLSPSQARKPERPRWAPPPSLDEPDLGRPGRSGRCTRRVLDSILHCKRQFTRAARRPQRPALPRRGARSEERGARSEERGAGSGERGARRPGEEWALRGVCSRFKFALAVPIQTPCNIATSRRDACGSTRSSRLTPRCGQGRQHATQAVNPARVACACRAALGRRASNSASPSNLDRAPIQPDSSISKSSPRDLEFQYPVVVLSIERARYTIVTPGESSATKGCSRHGFALALRCWHRSCSI